MAEPSLTTTESGQTWSAEGYAANARFVADLGEPLLDSLAPQPGEMILDLGCGDGVLSEKIRARGARVLAVDRSPELLAAARARGLDVLRADGQALPFEEGFDAVFSNAALHWMTDAAAVIAGVRRALKPGGRFVGEFGGHGNVAAIVTALRAVLRANGVAEPVEPVWFYPTVEEYATRLSAGGFKVEEIALIPRPTLLPTGISGWLETFAGPFLSRAELPLRAKLLAETEDLLAWSLRTADGHWTADYVRLRFRARRPG